ncbi:MAG: metallophosphoesterase [Candidatus Eisenbacteria bacterium]|nr:metallophosphoesterase [Candidatus Eisenbacteria bacterium]
MNHHRGGRTGSKQISRTAAAIAFSAALSLGFTWPWEMGDPWPGTSETPVAPLERPAPEERAAAIDVDPAEGYRFAVFGDQRALADGEWQRMIAHIDSIDRAGPPILFLVDTGDIVYNGTHTDQFAMLREILAPVERLPYLVAAGNHEVWNNKSDAARAHTARFLAGLDPALGPERLYFSERVGPALFLFLDTNDMVYGGGRNERVPAQIAWLQERLAAREEGVRTVIVVMHHPILQSSEKHRSEAAKLWNADHGGRRLVDLFLDGGVDLILTGHTHTYERFRIERAGGGALDLVNLSGRPRNDLFWFGHRSRRARSFAGREKEWLESKGWRIDEGWRITQEEVMTGEGADQFGLFTVGPDGAIDAEILFLGDDAPGGLRRGF